MKRTWGMLAALVLPRHASAQVPLDSVGIGAAIAAQLLADSSRDSRTAVVDTSDNRWNAFVGRAIGAQAPEPRPMLTDSATYYTSHFSVRDVAPVTGGVMVLVQWSLCHRAPPRDFSYAFHQQNWQFRETAARWEQVVPPTAAEHRAAITTGDGDCAPWRRKDAR